jgi:hypothetical protein
MTDKIRLTFELCNERKEFKQGEGEKPFSFSREFTYSFGAKGHLRPSSRHDREQNTRRRMA